MVADIFRIECLGKIAQILNRFSNQVFGGIYFFEVVLVSVIRTLFKFNLASDNT